MKRGERYRLTYAGGTLVMEVTRVARDGSWADLRVWGEYSMWTKRQPLENGKLPFDAKEIK